MADEGLRKKTLYLFAVLLLITIALLLFPYLDAAVRAALSTRLGFAVAEDWSLIPGDAPAPGKLVQNTVYVAGVGLQLLQVLLWMALVITLVRYIAYLATRTLYGSTPSGQASSLIKSVISILVYIVAFFVIFQSYFPNVQLAPLFTGSTIIGIVVGLALQDTLGNLFAGLALQADQPFQIGDVVVIQGRGEGVIESISWRGVKIRTFQNKLLIISNSVLGKEMIEVAPKDNLNARLVFFNTQYSHSPAKTVHAVREAVRTVDNVSRKIRPVVRIRDLAADGLNWEVKYWLEDYRLQHDTDALIRQRIWYVFRREGLHFAYPTRTLYMENKPAEMPAEEILNRNAERLGRVSIFAPLSEPEIEELANMCTSRVYAPGEMIVQEGSEGSSMFVITRGSVRVQVSSAGQPNTVGRLHENEFFGEMSLLTGAPRSASVVADEETEVLQIKKEKFQSILANHPGLIEAITELVEERRASLNSLSRSEASRDEASKQTVMQAIKRFFRLE
jgi:small-conductance mechanosensitive channel/CRP-like cAMP-binding protein